MSRRVLHTACIPPDPGYRRTRALGGGAPFSGQRHPIFTGGPVWTFPFPFLSYELPRAVRSRRRCSSMDPTISSILRPLRSWASSPSLSPPGFGTGGRQLKVPVSRVRTIPSPSAKRSLAISSPSAKRSAAPRHTTASSLRPPTLSPFLSTTGKPRHPYRPFQALHPGNLLPGHLFHRPRLLGSPAVRATTSLRRLALSTSLPHLRQIFVLLFYMEHGHQGPGPSRSPGVLSLGMKHGLPQ